MTNNAGTLRRSSYDSRLGSPVFAYFCQLDGALTEAQRAEELALLDDEERANHARYRREEDRDLYVRAHALTRRALSSQVPSVGPSAWRFARKPNERPALEAGLAGATGLRFNLTHTPGLVACVVSRAPEVGVDAECTTRLLDLGPVARTVYDDGELAALFALEAKALRARFFDLWTLKEAWLKARGFGFSCDPKNLAFSFDGEAREPRVRFDRAKLPAEREGAWAFGLCSPTPEHRLAVAVQCEGEGAPFELYEQVAGGGFEERARRVLPAQQSLASR